MFPKPDTCKNCPGYQWGTDGFMPAAVGTGSSGVLLVGEALGEQEALVGAPFAGKAGVMLNQMLQRIGVKRDDLWIDNCLRCSPPENKLNGEWYELDVLRHCAAHLDHTIETLKPKVIVTLGEIPLQRVLGLDKDAKITPYRGYVQWSEKYNCWVVPTYHPSYIMRGNQHLSGVWLSDLDRALTIAREGFDYHRATLHVDPTPAEMLGWVERYEGALEDDPTTLLSYDIETPMKAKGVEDDDLLDDPSYEILRVGFAFRAGEALSIPWSGEYVPLIRRLMGSAGVKVVWNGPYDNPRLIWNGVNISGEVWDGMLAWHVLQSDLPKKLEFVASMLLADQKRWKHLSSQAPGIYNCLQKGTRVVMADGRRLRIEEIVAKRLTDCVVGLDEAGQRITTPIIGWHRTTVKGQQWLEVKIDGTRQPIRCTPDHKIFTVDGPKRADELLLGDLAILPRRGSDDLIHGTLLGDAHVDRRGRLRLAHSVKQLEWFERKRAAVDGGKPSVVQGGYGAETIGCEAWVSKAKWRDKFYIAGKKHFVPPPSDRALAVWYCDDGCLSGGRGRIAVMGFSNYSVAVSWLQQEFGTISEYNKADYGSSIAIRSDAFFERIAPYVPPEMYYKLPPTYRGRYNGWIESGEMQLSPVVAITDITAKHYGKRRGFKTVRYCIDVAHPTHRFFTLGGLVKNCIDAEVTVRLMHLIKAQLEQAGLWKVFYQHVVMLDKVLMKMSAAGMPVDEGRRGAAREDLTTKLTTTTESIQTVVPRAAKRVKIFKRFREGAAETTTLAKRKVCARCGAHNITKPHVSKKTLLEDGTRVPNPCHGAEIVLTDIPTPIWEEVEPFVPSKTQMTSYQSVMGHKPVTSKKKGETGKITFDEGAIKELMKKYPEDLLYPLVLQYREVERLLSTYVEGLLVGKDGKVHTQYVHNPSTLRLASRAPNMQNCYDAATEVLTRSGWKLFRDLIPQEEVLQSDEGGRLTWVIPTAYTAYHYTGDLVTLHGDHVDVAVTPDHRILSYTRAGNPEWSTGQEWLAQWPGTHIVDRKFRRGGMVVGGRNLDTDELRVLEMAVCVQAEGHIRPDCDLVEIAVKSPRKRRQLQELFGGQCREGSGRLRVKLRKTHPAMEWLDEQKCFRIGLILGLSATALQQLLDMVMRWDGDSVRSCTYGQKRVRSGAVTAVELTAILSGHSTSRYCREHFDTVNVHHKSVRYASRLTVSAKPYDGMVYCVTVPTGAIVVRRNGCVLVCGNCPRGNGLGKIIKSFFVADPGTVVWEADFKAIEAQLVGYFAGSRDYIRLAKMGVHDFLNSHILARAGKIKNPADLNWSDADLVAFFEDLKARFKAERDVAKRVVHMSNYGGTPNRMVDANPETFPTIKIARSLQDLYFEVCPAVRKWQQHTVSIAAKQAYLRNPFGYLHRFWNVLNWKKERDGQWYSSWGEDAKRALAFLPQSTAAGIIKDAMLEIERQGLGGYLRLQVHDSLVAMIPTNDHAIADRLAAIMAAPCKALPLEPAWGMGPYLSIEVETKEGPSWGEAH